MSLVGLIAVVAGIALLALVVVRLAGWRIQLARRDRARRLQGTARLHALAAEEQRQGAIDATERAHTEHDLEAATEARKEAELELERANREAKRARALDPDVEVEPDPNVPRLD